MYINKILGLYTLFFSQFMRWGTIIEGWSTYQVNTRIKITICQRPAGIEHGSTLLQRFQISGLTSTQPLGTNRV